MTEDHSALHQVHGVRKLIKPITSQRRVKHTATKREIHERETLLYYANKVAHYHS